MNAINKETELKLKTLSSLLPMVMVCSTEKHIMTKEELDAMGYVGAEKLEDGKYIYRYPVQIAKNHYRAIKRRYKFGGSLAVAKYIDSVNSLKSL